MVFLGLVGMMDNPRPEVKASIQNCFKAGLKPIMITGDHKRTAFAIARELKIANSISQVFQDNFLFSGTIRENILIGNKNATNEEIEKECEVEA